MRQHSFFLGVFLLLLPLLISLPFTFFILPAKLTKAEKIEENPPITREATASAVLPESTSQGRPESSQSGDLLLKKTRGSITIAILGDSMVDTLGRDLNTLRASLTTFYPDVSFKLYNYGVGASSAEEALARVEQEYIYQNEKIPVLLSLNPDMVIIESFAYNHPPPTVEGRAQRLLTLETLAARVQEKTKAHILFLATIAPDANRYASGVPGVNWDLAQRRKAAEDVQTFLKDAIKFAQERELPLINAYQKSLDQNGDGEEVYIGQTDHIHPSPLGVKLISSLIAQKIHSLGFLEKVLR